MLAFIKHISHSNKFLNIQITLYTSPILIPATTIVKYIPNNCFVNLLSLRKSLILAPYLNPFDLSLKILTKLSK